jgi:DNA-binding CsgD family transcriptional regulator
VGVTVGRVVRTELQRLRRILAVVDLLSDATAEVALLPALLPALIRVVPADSVICAVQSPTSPVTWTWPGELLTPAAAMEFEHLAADDPLVTHTRTGSGEPVRRSDLQTRARYRALGTYARVYRPVGADHQLALAFPAGPGRSACLAFNRSHTDFSDDDVALATVLRPRLATAMTRLAPTPLHDPLTARQTEIVELLCAGHTNHQIAHRLGISPRTVDKHLELAYTKLHAHGLGRVTLAAQWHAEHQPT